MTRINAPLRTRLALVVRVMDLKTGRYPLTMDFSFGQISMPQAGAEGCIAPDPTASPLSDPKTGEVFAWSSLCSRCKRLTLPLMQAFRIELMGTLVMKYALLLAAGLCAFGLSANASSLLVNGDFEAGDTGFMTDLTQTSVGTGAAQYDVNTNPNAWFRLFASYGDNTSGSGNMMMVNGSTTPADLVWSQTVAVTAGTDYAFSGFISAMFQGSSVLNLEINGTAVGGIAGPATVAVWEAFSLNWSSGTATSATISLLQGTTGFGGNDFALDDLSFVATSTPPSPIPLPAAGWVLLAGLGALLGFGRRRA